MVFTTRVPLKTISHVEKENGFSRMATFLMVIMNRRRKEKTRKKNNKKKN